MLSFKFVSHRARISGKFHSRKYSHSKKFQWRPQIFRKLSFKELCDSNLLGVYPFVNMAIFTELKIGQKQKGRLWVYEKPILELIFLTITENSSVITNDIRDLRSIYNARNSCRDSYLATAVQFYLLTIRQHSATKKHLLLLP